MRSLNELLLNCRLQTYDCIYNCKFLLSVFFILLFCKFHFIKKRNITRRTKKDDIVIRGELHLRKMIPGVFFFFRKTSFGIESVESGIEQNDVYPTSSGKQNPIQAFWINLKEFL